MGDPMTPDQLQWVLEHNRQIRASHRVQIAEAVKAWRADQAAREGLAALVALLEEARGAIDPYERPDLCRRIDAALAAWLKAQGEQKR